MLVRTRLLATLLPAALLGLALALLGPAALALVGAGSPPPSAAAQMMDRPAWQSLPLTDARTGQTFTFADLAGKTVFVEPMATWCTNCRNQQAVIRDQVKAQLDPERFVFVGLSVETNLAPAALASYADAQGYDWTFAVASPELLAELAAVHGRTVTNPPATPHFIIGPDGTVGSLSTGFHTADALLGALMAAAGGM